ncbi:hypothetical protein [Streptomyces sp. C1-2]|uniref:hypothetical protein n=1 Tax=Streptomyces sp. C1-2 TaxID=2720022 RepID=UPI00143248D9|nr:hypothetical protein [Streptomyces sp. C1-2]NJP72173.1 hypothetical protein [Streptomyces sp. C1-2]
MAESTTSEGAADSAHCFAFCSWHREFSSSAVLARIIEQQSGPGVGMYACAPCREKHGLRPVGEQ